MRTPFSRALPALFGAAVLSAACPAAAAPWAEAGDAQLRSDVQLLAAAGVLDSLTSHWPLPWTGVRTQLADARLDRQSRTVQAAAARVRARAESETAPGIGADLTLDLTNTPAVVHGFDGLGRGKGLAQAGLTYQNGSGTSARIKAGVYSADLSGRGNTFAPDGSYIAQEWLGAIFYGGYVDHYWGPGWVSALSVSNNARPMPQIGVMRASTRAFDLPVLRWLGPWQIEGFISALDGPRAQPGGIYSALRVSLNPLPGLEIGLTRTDQQCGRGHACVPLRDYFSLDNDPTHTNATNDQGSIELRYTGMAWSVPYELYSQFMNEDSSPFDHSYTSHLFGGSVWLTARGLPLRLTAEYADTVPTLDIFSFGDVTHGLAYNNGGYPDGLHYRGRTLGASLDSDSRLLTLQASMPDRRGDTFTLSLHRAQISTPQNLMGNVVTTAPVTVNMAELRASIPWRQFDFDIVGRVQDDQPRPRTGATAAFELRVRYSLN